MRAIDVESELAELHHAGAGLIYNDLPGRGASGAQYNVLHAAGCHWVARSSTNVRKLFFSTRAEAVEWLEAHRGKEGEAWKMCGTCGGLPVTKPTATAVAPRERERIRWDVLPVDAVHQAVEAWTSVRLPFGAKGPVKEFQLALRAALRELQAGPGEVLARGVQKLCQSPRVSSSNSIRPRLGFAGNQRLISRDRLWAARRTDRARLTSTRRIWYSRARVKLRKAYRKIVSRTGFDGDRVWWVTRSLRRA